MLWIPKILRTSICAIWQTWGEAMKIVQIYCEANIHDLRPAVDTATVGELIEKLKRFPLDQKVILFTSGKYGRIRNDTELNEIEYREEYDMWRPAVKDT